MTVEGTMSQRPMHSAAQTRGFLFADIRGYTEYVERQGAAAASDLLARYRTIVRATIAEHEGAEIRTEGDSFYVVLPSASSAVVCGLAILSAVDADNKAHPDQPIRLGIGVHAGEAIETEQGLVGSAVNIAARLAALARPGEVLVSDTVRSLTRSVLPASYVPRGRHRLKGVAEPQEVFAAVPAGGRIVRVRSRRLATPIAAALGVVGLALVVGLVYVALPAGANPGTSPSPTLTLAAVQSGAPTVAPTAAASATLTASPTANAASGPTIIKIPDIDPIFGTYTPFLPDDYRFYSFRPILVLHIDAAWTDRSWYPLFAGPDFSALFAAGRGVGVAWDPRDPLNQGMLELDFVRTQTAFGNPCDPGDTTANKLLGGRPRDIVDWLSNERFLSATNLQPAEVAGWTGLSIEVQVSGDPGRACSGSTVPGQGSVFLFKTTPVPPGWGGLYVMHDGEKAQFTVVDIGGDVPLILVARSRVGDYADRLPWAQELIDTITVVNE